MYIMKGITLILGLTLFCSTAFSKIVIPLDKQFLILNFNNSYQLKKKCDDHAKISCFEVWNKSIFLSINISDLSENRFLKSNFKQICKSKIDQNKFKLKFCQDKQTKEIYFLKNKHLITFSFKPETKITKTQLNELINAVQ